MGESSRSDGREYQYGGIMGANLADGRGNVMLAFSVNDRGKALHIDRPWFEDMNNSPTRRAMTASSSRRSLGLRPAGQFPEPGGDRLAIPAG